MSKRSKKTKSDLPSHQYNPSWDRAEYEVTRMKHPDLQRACVARGMDFQAVVEASIPELHHWFVRNYDTSQSLVLLNEFDSWKEEEFKKLGYEKGDPFFHPSLRLGFNKGSDDEGNSLGAKKPRLKGLKKEEKPKKERVEGFKIFKGTKKAMTYQLTSEGLSIGEIWAQVKAQFDDANEKSVNIWHKRCLKEKPKPKK